MSRSPLAYPLTRGIDGDSGGAADLQTDIMRFMAILALCLVAVFALVQSIPLAPEVPRVESPATPPQDPVAVADVPRPNGVEQPQLPPVSAPAPAATPPPSREAILTRPAWTPKFTPAERPAAQPDAAATVATSATDQAPPAAASETTGFTLRFETDLALTRLVASGQVGFYAIEHNRARRMAVHESQISFWDASTPNQFHEMEASTVPKPVVAALTRSGADAAAVDFGVTLPSRLREQLARLMSEHSGGELIIGADGDLHLEAGR